jgi:hypothetical protein
MTVAELHQGAITPGREVCIRDIAGTVRTGTDGLLEIKLGTTPSLYADVPAMYLSAGVMMPTAGQTVSVHGMLRWDLSHMDYELLPVDWIGP